MSKSHGKFTEVKKSGVTKSEEETERVVDNMDAVLHTDGISAIDKLERLIGINNIGMSVDHVLDTAKAIITIRAKIPETGRALRKHSSLTKKISLSSHFSRKETVIFNFGDALTKLGRNVRQRFQGNLQEIVSPQITRINTD